MPILLVLLLAVTAAPPPAPGTLTVSVTDARSADGQVVALVFASADGFPVHPDRAAYRGAAPIRGTGATVRIPGVAAGRYAIVVFHDADGNSRIQRNVIGLPREGIGVTRFSGGRPSFRSSTVSLSGDDRLTIALTYR